MVMPSLGGDTKEEQVWRGGDLDSALDMLSVSCLKDNQLAAVWVCRSIETHMHACTHTFAHLYVTAVIAVIISAKV